MPLAPQAEKVVLNRFLCQKRWFPGLGGRSSRLFRGRSQKHQIQTPKQITGGRWANAKKSEEISGILHYSIMMGLIKMLFLLLSLHLVQLGFCLMLWWFMRTCEMTEKAEFWWKEWWMITLYGMHKTWGQKAAVFWDYNSFYQWKLIYLTQGEHKFLVRPFYL